MDNRQSFGACLGSLLSGILALVQVPAWGGLSGRRYEHIHVRLTEAIHGFRHSRKGLPKPAPMLRCRLPQEYAKDYWRQVPSDERVWVGVPKICGAMDGGAEAPHGCAARNGFRNTDPHLRQHPTTTA